MSEMTCYSCRYSEAIGFTGDLICKLTDEQAETRCEQFEYEPGTDEEQRSWPITSR